jgi:hypothetical protein
MENKEAKVVHFPEILTLRAKHGVIESHIRLTVKEVRTFGFEELCELYLDTEQVMDWRDDAEPKRFAMKVLTAGLVPETPPWILMEFGHPTETRDIEHLYGTSYIRTITKDGHTVDKGVQDFKHTYSLVDATGHAVNEVDEADLAQIHYFRVCLSWIVWIVTTLIVFALLIFALFRFYLWSCYRQFYAITQAKLNQKSFPLSSVQIKDVMKKCTLAVEGAGYKDGAHPCKPSDAQVNEVCHSPPPGQPWPGAGRMLVESNLGIKFSGLTCYSHPSPTWHDVEPTATGVMTPDNTTATFDRGMNVFAKLIDSVGGTCEMRQLIQPWDNPAYAIAAGSICFLFVCRFAANSLIRTQRNRLAGQGNALIKSMQTKLRNERATRTGRSTMG